MQDNNSGFWPRGVPRDLPVPKTTLHHNLAVAAARHPEKTAIAYYGARLSYGELARQADALAGYLQHECGVARGDRVLLYMQNSPQFVIAYYAILRADAVIVPVNPMNLTGELKHYVDDAGATAALCGQELLSRIQPLCGTDGLAHLVVANYGDYANANSGLFDAGPSPDFLNLPPLEGATGVVPWGTALDARRVPRASQSVADDLCAMPYTSGTTGKPKGCMHTHATLMANAVSTAVWSGTSADDVMLAAVPFFHITGMVMVMHSGIYLGAELVVMTRWDRELALRLIRLHKITSWTNIPTMVIDLFASANFKSDSLADLRHIAGGGAAMPEAVAKRLFELTGLEFLEGYGQTETAGPSHFNHRERAKRQCLGIPICNTESMVINPESLAPLGADGTGEIVTRGPQVFKGYWNSPHTTGEAFIDIGGKTFFRTGDLGRRDDEGYYFIVDRLKRMINASGFKVWPAEVESMMYAHPDILEACVIASPDAHRGETVKAIVVLKQASRGGVTSQGIIDWCRERMAVYKIPRIVEFAESLPKSATGKLMWRQLQEQEREKAAPLS